MIVAVVLGGSDHADPLARKMGVAAKALVPIGGKPMAIYILEALRESVAVSASIYVGSADARYTRFSNANAGLGRELDGEPSRRARRRPNAEPGARARRLR